MSGMVSLAVVGRVGKDAEMSLLPDGTERTVFSMVVDKYTKAGEVPVWFRVTCWRKTAEFAAKYVRKGGWVSVSTNMVEASAWTDKEGAARSSLEITAERISLVGNKPAGEATEAEDVGGGGAVPRVVPATAADSDMPF